MAGEGEEDKVDNDSSTRGLLAICDLLRILKGGVYTHRTLSLSICVTVPKAQVLLIATRFLKLNFLNNNTETVDADSHIKEINSKAK